VKALKASGKDNLITVGATGMKRDVLEPYVSPDEAAEFLKVNRLKMVRMARSGILPAHPLGTGKRRQWRFKLSELDKHMQGGIETNHPPVRQ
jgi:excisionase family DNA binding protein